MMWRSFFPSERLYSTAKFLRLDEASQSLLMRLYSCCDRWGRGPASPDMLSMHLRLQRDVSQELERLSSAGFVELYEADGDRFYSIAGFDDDAFADITRKRGDSAFPNPPTQEKTSGRPRADQGQAKGRLRAGQGQAEPADSAGQGQAKPATQADQGQTVPATQADQGQTKGRPEESRVEEQRRAQTSSSLRAETDKRQALERLPPIVRRLLENRPDNTPRTPQQELALELLRRAESHYRGAFRFITANSLVCLPFGDAIAEACAEDELEKWLITSNEKWRWQTVRAYLRETVQRFELPWDPDEWMKPEHQEDVRL